MSTAIFIRSYNKDFEWLSYCVRSIRKFCSGFNEVVLAVPIGHYVQLTDEIKNCVDHIHPVEPRTSRGYLDQQITKLRAHHYTDADQILYVDSDCLFAAPATPETFMRDGKPLLLKTAYDVFRSHQQRTGEKQNVLCWQPITEAAIGFPVAYEYMRRLPILHDVRTLLEVETRYPRMIDHIRSIHGNGFSEFNALGAVAERYLSDLYHIQDTETEPLPPIVCEQSWSWGGISDEKREHMEWVCR